MGFAFALTVRGRLAFRFWFVGRLLLSFKLSFAFLLAGFRFDLLSLALAFALVELLFSGLLAESLLVLDVVVLELSPSFVGRLMSTATVCPTLTISPAWGS